MRYYSGHAKLYVAVDCIIFGFDEERRILQLLLLKRSFEPEKGKWSLMGGFVREEESLDMAAQRIVRSLTGLENVYLEQMKAFGDPGRDTGGRIISVAYFSLIKISEHDREQVKCHNASWVPVSQIPPLIFDHNRMVDCALKTLKIRARTQPVGFELLPEKFTLPQLQGLYEAIFGRSFDKRNFRRKLLSMGLLERLDEKEKESSKRGAFYYRYRKPENPESGGESLNFGI